MHRSNCAQLRRLDRPLFNSHPRRPRRGQAPAARRGSQHRRVRRFTAGSRGCRRAIVAPRAYCRRMTSRHDVDWSPLSTESLSDRRAAETHLSSARAILLPVCVPSAILQVGERARRRLLGLRYRAGLWRGRRRPRASLAARNSRRARPRIASSAVHPSAAAKHVRGRAGRRRRGAAHAVLAAADRRRGRGGRRGRRAPCRGGGGRRAARGAGRGAARHGADAAPPPATGAAGGAAPRG